LTDLLIVSPAPLVVVIICIGVITLATTQLKEIATWNLVLPPGRLFDWIQYHITTLRLTYIVMVLYSVIPFFSLSYLVMGGNPKWLDEVAIWALLVLGTFTFTWAVYGACARRETPIRPMKII